MSRKRRKTPTPEREEEKLQKRVEEKMARDPEALEELDEKTRIDQSFPGESSDKHRVLAERNAARAWVTRPEKPKPKRETEGGFLSWFRGRR